MRFRWLWRRKEESASALSADVIEPNERNNFWCCCSLRVTAQSTRRGRALWPALMFLRQHVDDFALFRHAEVFAGDALDGVGRLLHALDLAAEARVFRLQPVDVRTQLVDALARLLQLRDAAIAEEEREAEDDGENACEKRERPERHARIAHRRSRGRHR